MTHHCRLSVLLIDNFDSFTFNLVDEFVRRQATVCVKRNSLSAAAAWQCLLDLPEPRLIVLSPGPATPKQAGCCIDLISLAAAKVPIFGVCLGHQAIIEAFGGVVGVADTVVHGKASRIEHNGAGCFQGLPSPLLAGRYHSLCAHTVPSDFTITASCANVVMAVEHKAQPIIGVQFHPESILTPQGGLIIENVLSWAKKHNN
jgi:anthranilate synthase component II